MEKTYSKDEILELYLNLIYFGKGYYGINNASNGFFDKDPSDLSLYEATYLAGLPNAPSIYSEDETLRRRKKTAGSLFYEKIWLFRRLKIYTN